MKQSTGGVMIQRIEDWLRECAVQRARRLSKRAAKSGDRDAFRVHARRMLAEIQARSPEEWARRDAADLKRLRAMGR